MVSRFSQSLDNFSARDQVFDFDSDTASNATITSMAYLPQTIVLCEPPHESFEASTPTAPSDRMKTGCLNISVDPPHVIKISPWIDNSRVRVVTSNTSTMEQDVSAAIPTMISEIPVDLFITRKRLGFATHGDLTFTNGNGDLIFTLDQTSSIFHLLDAQGISLFSISRDKFGWQGCVGDSKDPVFKVKITRQSYRTREAEVFSLDKDLADFVYVFKMRGCPFHRSCTIYQHNQILAQTSLMYKLRKLITGRRRFRLTIFPGYISHSLLAALVVIFFHGSI